MISRGEWRDSCCNISHALNPSLGLGVPITKLSSTLSTRLMRFLGKCETLCTPLNPPACCFGRPFRQSSGHKKINDSGDFLRHNSITSSLLEHCLRPRATAQIPKRHPNVGPRGACVAPWSKYRTSKQWPAGSSDGAYLSGCPKQAQPSTKQLCTVMLDRNTPKRAATISVDRLHESP
ncbi:unnamed protein product [Trypanosoma congolense IL3000]|uniref:WGS project CAEQ00000000 data, annotated contig 985 n=1 Tax=Trypanosoma congolense (strain IL3000) TaxID=1068625 RepID=F9WK46_TRYCI|nr:unnamed protein product [Trypanosoma congolense IL3000]